jgi:hypothetical protein
MTFGPHADPELLLSRLSFSHFAELITIQKQQERAFYEIECVRGAWSVRELKRQIGALYFERSAFCIRWSYQLWTSCGIFLTPRRTNAYTTATGSSLPRPEHSISARSCRSTWLGCKRTVPRSSIHRASLHGQVRAERGVDSL